MAEVTSKMVNELRERSGAPLMDCKRALSATQGDVEAAFDHLRKAGLKTADKKAGRSMEAGRIGAQIDAANTGIAIAVLGQNLTTEVQGGSYAAAQVHQQVADYLRRADAECLSTTLRTQVLTWWAAYNFGDPAVAPWPRWKIDPEADAASVGAAYKALGDGIASLRDAVPEGQALDLGAILERAGVPLVDAPDVPEALPEPALTVGTVSQAVTGGS